MQESYSKRMNIVIHGITEDTSKAWESREETEAKFQKFV